MYFSIFSMLFEENNKYTVVIEENGVVQKKVEFSSDRKCCTVQGLVLVKDGDINQYLNQSVNELNKKLGEAHADIGSGLYIPAYITENGYLIYFYVENDTVFEVVKRDILTNEIIECVQQ